MLRFSHAIDSPDGRTPFTSPCSYLREKARGRWCAFIVNDTSRLRLQERSRLANDFAANDGKRDWGWFWPKLLDTAASPGQWIG